MNTKTNGPFGSARVIDLADERGVYGTKLLADLGADVIRIEPPGGDPMRQLAPFLGNQSGPERSLVFSYMNTNKRSLVADLSATSGMDILRELASTADVVFFSGLSEEYDRLELERLLTDNPSLVVAAVTPFGLTGPMRHWRGGDLIAWASGGLAFTLGDPDRPPVAPAPTAHLSYILAGQYSAMASLAALRHARRTGAGQRVDVSLQESVAAVSGESGVSAFLDDGIPRVRAGSKRPLTAPLGHYPTTDGYASVLALMPNHWEALRTWILEKTGNEGVMDPALAGGPQSRAGGAWHVVNLFTEDLTKHYSRQELFEEGQRRGIAVTPVNDAMSVVSDEQLEERDFWTELDVAGESVRSPGPPYRLSRTPWQPGRAPGVGEHTEQVMAELHGRRAGRPSAPAGA